MILFYKVEFFEVRLEGGHAIKSNLFMNLKSVSGLSSSLFLIFHFLFTFVRAHFWKILRILTECQLNL